MPTYFLSLLQIFFEKNFKISWTNSYTFEAQLILDVCCCSYYAQHAWINFWSEIEHKNSIYFHISPSFTDKKCHKYDWIFFSPYHIYYSYLDIS